MTNRYGLIVLVLLAAAGATPARAQLGVKTYQTRYYTLHTDLDAQGVQDVTRRITVLAEEYHQRTRGFAGAVDRRLPFHVFRHEEDYHAAGGMPGSAGVFMGDRLMALAGEQISSRTWHVIQHEGFHQFAHAAIGDDLPTWVDEGLAEYFGLGRFTGDQFYTGFIPPERLAVVQKCIQDDIFRPLDEMMNVSLTDWNIEIQVAHQRAGVNYLQAWAMVHFLAHADNGRYQDAFSNFVRAISRRQSPDRAWTQAFGNDVKAFQRRFNEYWLGLSENPTENLAVEAAVSTLTSFYARAFSQRQFFDRFEEFAEAAEAGELKAEKRDWLSPELLQTALEEAPQLGTWSVMRRGRPGVICERPDGTVIHGRFRLNGQRVKNVFVDVRAPKRKRK